MTPVISLRDLPTPALLLDLDILEANIARQASRAARLGVSLRPHIKTHKCIEVARLQQSAGARGITVSTLAEARVFIDHGFTDVLWAFPVIPSRVPEVRELAARARLTVVVDSERAIDALEDAGVEVSVWIKVDCGGHRAGVDPAGQMGPVLGERLAASRTLRLGGVLTHAGQAYRCRGGVGLAQVAEDERAAVCLLAERLRADGMTVDQVSVGSTPTMSAVSDLSGVTEMRPGNYTFHDYTQTVIGTAGVEECALSVLSTVVTSRPDGGWSVIDAGGLALSQDPGPSADVPTMGRIYEDYDAARLDDSLMVASVSQEHGVVSGVLSVGDRVRILPNHSCMTAACFDRYHVVRGQRVVDLWPIHRRR